jgi:hypothetical protein
VVEACGYDGRWIGKRSKHQSGKTIPYPKGPAETKNATQLLTCQGGIKLGMAFLCPILGTAMQLRGYQNERAETNGEISSPAGDRSRK